MYWIWYKRFPVMLCPGWLLWTEDYSHCWDGTVMWNVGMMNMWAERCWRCRCHEKEEEDQRGGIWMWWRRTCNVWRTQCGYPCWESQKEKKYWVRGRSGKWCKDSLTCDDSFAVYTAVYFFPESCSFDITEPMIESTTGAVEFDML